LSVPDWKDYLSNGDSPEVRAQKDNFFPLLVSLGRVGGRNTRGKNTLASTFCHEVRFYTHQIIGFVESILFIVI